MADRDVNTILLISGLGDRVQRGDRTALNDIEAVLSHAPFDILRTAEVRLDPPSQGREPHDLGIGQRRLLLLLDVDRPFLRPAPGHGVDREALGTDGPGDDHAVAHLAVLEWLDHAVLESHARDPFVGLN